MAVTVSQPLDAMNPSERRGYKCLGATTYYANTVAFLTSAGYASHTATSNRMAGVVVEEVVNSGAAGDKNVEVFTEGDFVIACTGADQSWVGKLAKFTDNFTVTTTSVTGEGHGMITEFISATKVRVRLNPLAVAQ